MLRLTSDFDRKVEACPSPPSRMNAMVQKTEHSSINLDRKNSFAHLTNKVQVQKGGTSCYELEMMMAANTQPTVPLLHSLRELKPLEITSQYCLGRNLFCFTSTPGSCMLSVVKNARCPLTSVRGHLASC